MQAADPNRRLRRHDYAEIVDTHDEWEGLIGIVEGFLDAEGAACRGDSSQLDCVVLHVPTDRETQARHRLRDVNEITSFVRGLLRAEDDRCCLKTASLAWYDRDWL